MKYYILYNPYAGMGFTDEKKNIIESKLGDVEKEYINITNISYRDFFGNRISSEDKVLLTGGDGTLNCFINDTSGVDIKNDIFYMACGTGNDFLNDIGEKPDTLISLNKYIEKLPSVKVENKTFKFINGVGFGIDGYCCEVGDEIKKSSDKPVNYTSIAIKGLLMNFKPRNATVTVDGKRFEYTGVWLAPTMNGRYYGGMIPTPQQDRFDDDGKLSILIWHKKSKFRTLMAFPSIFEGKHVEKTEMCAVHTGHQITVEFDRPTPLQIDGETISDVTSYTAKSHKL